MALSRSRVLYPVAMLASAITPLVWPFLVSLVLDLAIRQAAEPLSMGDRLLGVFGAGLIVTPMITLGG